VVQNKNRLAAEVVLSSELQVRLLPVDEATRRELTFAEDPRTESKQPMSHCAPRREHVLQRLKILVISASLTSGSAVCDYPNGESI